jgi:hypothetical protein
MLKGDSYHPGEVFRCPDFVKCIPLCKAARGAEREMSLSVMDRIIDIGMSFIIFRKKEYGSQINRISPEFGKQFALYFNVLYPFGIFRGFDRRDNLIHAHSYGVSGGGIEINRLDFAVKVSR